MRMCGYNKALITLVKYWAQAYLNWARKSTLGWSLANVMMDLGGTVLSFGQILVDSGARGKPLFGSGRDTGFNIVKFMLSIIGGLFDVVFLFQHYVLYGEGRRKDTRHRQVKERIKRLESFEKA